MRGVIRLGDPTSHGGRVVSTGSRSVVMGRTVAVLGDRCVCPRKGHGSCVIAEGDPDVRLDGKPVAFDGHRTSCGAQLISTVPASGRGG
ncbi:MAG: hypothetical protein C0607_21615 [Azoarcus sp.]|nr:MAG: hypothetical protein C0607_21615 [Azoarcus sp.]TVT53425.1 MAG: PAAR domain-containing protein [Azoarcus sp. PHD]